MKKYMVEFTASVTGSLAGRDDGQPYRTTLTQEDKFNALRIFKKKCDEKNNRYGWKPPKFYEMEVVELDPCGCLYELEQYEKTKNHGADI